MKYLKLGLPIAALGFLTACAGGFKKNENGLKYHMVTETGGKKPVDGDVISIHFNYSVVTKSGKDSVIYNTRESGQAVRLQVTKPTYKGSIEEGFAMLAAGDSADFQVNVDTLFIKTQHMPTPTFVKNGTDATFHVKMMKIESKAEMDAANAKAMAERQKLAATAAAAEPKAIADYLKANNINVKPTTNGVYVQTIKMGTGPVAANGKTVTFNYVGRFLDGKVFDTNIAEEAKKANIYNGSRPYEAVSVPLGQNQLIKGWEEGMTGMKQGGKVLMVIPSAQAYGENGAANVIPPNTPLAFEVELVSVK